MGGIAHIPVSVLPLTEQTLEDMARRMRDEGIKPLRPTAWFLADPPELHEVPAVWWSLGS